MSFQMFSSVGSSSIRHVTKRVPSTPLSVTGVAGNTKVTLSWNVPYDGGSIIINYNIQYSSDSGTTWILFDTNPTTNSTIVTSLTNSVSYIFQVRANNSMGSGNWSSSSSNITPTLIMSSITISAGTLNDGLACDERYVYLINNDNLRKLDTSGNVFVSNVQTNAALYNNCRRADILCSSDGTKICYLVSNDYIYVWNGTSFTQVAPFGAGVTKSYDRSISSLNMTTIYTDVYVESMTKNYKSTNSGSSFTEMTNVTVTGNKACSSNGSIVYIVDGRLHYSSNGLASISRITDLTSINVYFDDVACSETGSIVYCIDYVSGQIFKSIDSGVSFSKLTNSPSINSILKCSNDGNIVVTAVGSRSSKSPSTPYTNFITKFGNINISYDGGTNWNVVVNTTTIAWYKMIITPNNKVYAWGASTTTHYLYGSN